MKKVFLILSLLFMIGSAKSQDQQVKDFLSKSNSLYKTIQPNISESEVQAFFSELSTIESEDELHAISSKYFGDGNSEDFEANYINFIESCSRLAKLGLSRGDLKAMIIDSKVDIPMFSCIDLAGYERCMAPLDDEFEGETIDFVVNFGAAVLGVISSEGIGLLLGGAAYAANAARHMSNAIDKHGRGRYNCYQKHCVAGGGGASSDGPGGPGGGIPTYDNSAQ